MAASSEMPSSGFCFEMAMKCLTMITQFIHRIVVMEKILICEGVMRCSEPSKPRVYAIKFATSTWCVLWLHRL